jgi:hypothetical protein
VEWLVLSPTTLSTVVGISAVVGVVTNHTFLFLYFITFAL